MIKRNFGFTLIELLIVVAIIAILAAIALPNFLEAQTRAKVSRVKNDMRAIATALEAFYVDNNAYIAPTGNGIPTHLKNLSTPIAYITQGQLKDQFKDQQGKIEHKIGYYGCNDENISIYAHSTGIIPWDDTSRNSGMPKILWYILLSTGPDNDLNGTVGSLPGSASKDAWNDPSIIIQHVYDPTNGTISNGEIFRLGGQPAGNFIEGANLVRELE